MPLSYPLNLENSRKGDSVPTSSAGLSCEVNEPLCGLRCQAECSRVSHCLGVWWGLRPRITSPARTRCLAVQCDCSEGATDGENAEHWALSRATKCSWQEHLERILRILLLPSSLFHTRLSGELIGIFSLLLLRKPGKADPLGPSCQLPAPIVEKARTQGLRDQTGAEPAGRGFLCCTDAHVCKSTLSPQDLHPNLLFI